MSKQVNAQAKEKADQYLASMEKGLKANLKVLNQEVLDTQTKLNGLKRTLTATQNQQRNQRVKEVIQDVLFVLGAFVASLGVLILIFAFFTTLYSFGWHHIWAGFKLSFHAPTWEKGLTLAVKVVFSIGYFLLGLFLMFTPLMAYQKFLQGIEYRYTGIAGRLNKFFNQ